MKKFCTIILFSVFAASVNAQTFAEWFKQKKTQKKYLLQQIAGLEVYLDYLKKGYSIAESGLNTISGIKKGDFTIHDIFLKSLDNVNVSLGSGLEVGRVISIQSRINEIYNRTYSQVKKSNAFTGQEFRYVQRVYSRLMIDCTTVLNDLIAVTSDDKLEMKDDERLKRINRLYEDMLDKFSFAKSFSNETILIAEERAKEKRDVQSSRFFNDVPKKP